jgi:hypothetical protein
MCRQECNKQELNVDFVEDDVQIAILSIFHVVRLMHNTPFGAQCSSGSGQFRHLKGCTYSIHINDSVG